MKRKRLGHVKRGIIRALIAAGGRECTTRELFPWCFPRAEDRPSRARHNQARSIRRAGDKVAVRVGRRARLGIVWRLRE
jgi:hypothetical protein